MGLLRSFHVGWLAAAGMSLTATAISLAAIGQTTPSITLQQNGPIVLVAGAGSGTFTLTGDGDLHLNFGTVTDKTSLAVVDKVSVSPKTDAPDQTIPATLSKVHPLVLRVDVSGVKGASAIAIPVFTGPERIGQLEAYAEDAPMNVTISGDGASGTPLIVNPNKPSFVTLKNGDAEAYTLRWKFRYRTLELCSTVKLLGNGSARVALRAGDDVYAWYDRIRPSAETGHMELGLDTGEACCTNKAATECVSGTAAAGNGGVAGATLPARDLPVSMTMQSKTPTRTTIWADGYVIACLIIGGLLSLLASSVLPNSLRKSAFRRQLKDLASRTTGVSLRVDSNLRVLLRLERNRIREALKSTWVMLPNASASLDDVGKQVDQLTQRLGVAERIDDLRLKLESAYETSPPSVVEDVDAALQAAADAMHSYSLSSDDIGAANKSLAAATQSLGTLDNSADLAKAIAAKFTELKTRLANFLPNYADLKTALPGVFGVLREPFNDAKNITPRMVYAIDYCVAAINTVLDFAVLRQEVPAEAPAPAADAAAGADAGAEGGGGAAGPVNYVNPRPTNDVVDKARAHQTELTRLLSSMAWQALREARLLVQEMREDTYEEDVIEELKPGRAWVAFETMRARPYLPINFYVHYLKWGRETRAAMERLSFRWTFPGELQEEGTRVCHYFTGKEKGEETEPSAARSSSEGEFPGFFTRLFPGLFPGARKLPVEVTVNRRTALPAVAGVPAVPAAVPGETGWTLKGSIAIDPEEAKFDWSRLFAETLRFGIAFGVALAGLLSGGIQQIAKLDLVPATLAIIGLGFGADAIKNVLTQPAPSAAKTPPAAPSAPTSAAKTS
jgi:hypothetical protein